MIDLYMYEHIYSFNRHLVGVMERCVCICRIKREIACTNSGGDKTMCRSYLATCDYAFSHRNLSHNYPDSRMSYNVQMRQVNMSAEISPLFVIINCVFWVDMNQCV